MSKMMVSIEPNDEMKDNVLATNQVTEFALMSPTYARNDFNPVKAFAAELGLNDDGNS